jgi:hypothetical protein
VLIKPSYLHLGLIFIKARASTVGDHLLHLLDLPGATGLKVPKFAPNPQKNPQQIGHMKTRARHGGMAISFLPFCHPLLAIAPVASVVSRLQKMPANWAFLAQRPFLPPALGITVVPI